MTAPQPGLGRQMAKGAGWMVLMRLAIRSVGVVSTIILARLLLPEDFGLVALAYIVIEFLDIMGAFDFEATLVSMNDTDRKLYDTAWTLGLLRGVLTALLLLLLAWPSAVFFSEPRLFEVLLFFSIVPLIDSLKNIGTVDFYRELRLDLQFNLNVGSKLASFSATIIAALIFRNYWALLIGTMTGTAARTVLSYFMSAYRPGFRLEGWKPLVHFSKWLAVNGVISFFGRKADAIILGRFTSASSVGTYTLAKEVSSLPTSELAIPIHSATLPGYARLAHDHVQLSHAYLNTLALICLAALPLGFGISLTAELAVPIVLGPNWGDAIPLIQILAAAGTIRILGANQSAALMALKRPKVISYIYFASTAVVIPSLYVGVVWAGPVGAAWATFGSTAFTTGISLIVANRVFSISYDRFMAVFWRPVLACAAMALVVQFVALPWALAQTGGMAILALAVTVGAGAIVYLAGLLGLWRTSGSPRGAEADALDTFWAVLRRLKILPGRVV